MTSSEIRFGAWKMEFSVIVQTLTKSSSSSKRKQARREKRMEPSRQLVGETGGGSEKIGEKRR